MGTERRRRAVGLAALLALAVAAPSAAAEPGAFPALTLGGFGTLGAVRTSSDQVEFVRDLSQPDGAKKGWSAKVDSVVGLQANLRLSERTEGVAQVVARYGHKGDFRPELTWAFLKHEPSAAVSLRAGRLGTEFYMLADSRLVGYSYLTVRPSNDYYGTLPFSYIDGADVLLTRPLAGGLLRAKGFLGLAREKLPLSDREWDIAGSRLAGGYLDYQRGAWQWRATYAQLRFRDNLPIDGLTHGLRLAGAAAAADALTVEDEVSRFWSVGAVYDDGPLQVQAMLSSIRQESVLFEEAKAGYVVAGYRIGEVTPFLGYSRVRSTPNRFATGLPDVGPLALLNAAVASVLADSHSDQRTVSFGARWDVYRNVALKAQVDVIRGKRTSIFPYRWEKAGWDGRMEVFSLSMDFVF